MKLSIVDVKNGQKGSVELPKQFSEEVRPDLVAKSVVAIDSHNRQPYGSDPEAGKKSSAELSRRRRNYRGSYGIGISRVPRKILTRRGTRMFWVGAFAPGTVGGRRAHAPKSEKIWAKKINDKERQKAIRSAISATVNKDLVKARGHIIPDAYPFVLNDDFQMLSKTKDVVVALNQLGFGAELERTQEKSIRAGKGKVRGRKYRRKTGILVVVSDDCPLLFAGINIPGVDVMKVSSINASVLAPGADIGRVTLFTEAALKKMDEQKLFFPKLKMFKDLIKVVKPKSVGKSGAAKSKSDPKDNSKKN